MSKRGYKAYAGSSSGRSSKKQRSGGFNITPITPMEAAALQTMANMRTGGYMGLEKKFIDYEYDAAVNQALAGAEADPTEGALNAIAQGDGESNRDGRKCTLVGVHLKGYVQRDADTSATPLNSYLGCTARLVVVHDKQTNGAALNAEDVFEDPTDTDLEPLVFRNLAYTKRFSILHDEVINLDANTISVDPATGEWSSAVRQMFTVNKKLNVPVLFTGTTANVSTISDSSIHVLCWTGANDAPATLRYISRVRFVG